MGLAAYGDHGGKPFPFVRLDGDGFPTYDREAMHETLGEIRPRPADEPPIDGHHEHVAARLQLTLEAAIARIAEVLHERTGLRDVCLAGGVALNCSSNGKLLELPFVDRVFVQPAASDSGTALGAAVQVYVERSGGRPGTRFDHAYWGPGFSNEQIEQALRRAKVPYRRSRSIAEDTARLIADGKIVGWFQGRTEFGPRALGARSILADPRNPAIKDAVNREAKFREPWRPFAPSILAERMHEYFGTDHQSEFMILAFPGTESRADDPGHAARRRQRPPADGRSRDERAVSQVDRGLRIADRRAGRPQHELQRRQRADRVLAHGRASHLLCERHRRAGHGRFPPGEECRAGSVEPRIERRVPTDRRAIGRVIEPHQLRVATGR